MDCQHLCIFQHHSWLSNLNEGVQYGLVERSFFPELTAITCDDSCDPVIYDRATQMCTVVSKFPRKTWETVGAQTVCDSELMKSHGYAGGLNFKVCMYSANRYIQVKSPACNKSLLIDMLQSKLALLPIAQKSEGAPGQYRQRMPSRLWHV